VKNCELICRVNALAEFALPFHSPVSVTVLGVTVSKLPRAEVITVPDARVEISLPFPMTLGRGPLRGGFGNFDGGLHGTSRHSLFGYEAVKHPFFGTGTLPMSFSHSCRRCVSAS
jgi:hypothetical protein